MPLDGDLSTEPAAPAIFVRRNDVHELCSRSAEASAINQELMARALVLRAEARDAMNRLGIASWLFDRACRKGFENLRAADAARASELSEMPEQKTLNETKQKLITQTRIIIERMQAIEERA